MSMNWSQSPLNFFNTTVASFPFGGHTANTSQDDHKNPSCVVMNLNDVLVAFKGLYDGKGAPVKPAHNLPATGFAEHKTPLRVRRPEEEVIGDPKYMEKFKQAVQKLKDLPDDDPLSFYKKGKIHVDYSSCNKKTGQSGVPSHVDNSLIFLAGQRYYLYYYERVLGKLIEDDTFTLPYRNFDYLDGMTLPSISIDESSPFYHTGEFLSSGRDALFYGMHANIDRMWDVYTKTIRDINHFDDPEWLNAAFYYYDENRQVARVKLADCFDSPKLGYRYKTPSGLPFSDRYETPSGVPSELHCQKIG